MKLRRDSLRGSLVVASLESVVPLEHQIDLVVDLEECIYAIDVIGETSSRAR